MRENVHDEITTELAAIGAKNHAPVWCTLGTRAGFPTEIQVSVNNEAVHGILGNRRIRPSDLVKLDVTFEKEGYVADAAITVLVEPAPEESLRLAHCAKRAFHRAMRASRAGNGVHKIGREIEREMNRSGFTVPPALATASRPPE